MSIQLFIDAVQFAILLFILYRLSCISRAGDAMIDEYATKAGKLLEIMEQSSNERIEGLEKIIEIGNYLQNMKQKKGKEEDNK